MPMTSDAGWKPLNRLVATWATEATHPSLPGIVVHGTAIIEWLEGERFLIHRARTDHPEFPDSISIIGFTDRDRIDNAPSIDPATKSMTGHLLGAAGGLEAGITALAVKHQVIPPTINYEVPDPECDLDYVPNQKRQAAIEYALSNSFGFGGTNGALLFRRYGE